MSEKVRILEAGNTGRATVDREAGIIYGVKLLGEESRNPPPHQNVYPRTTREAALKLFEGLRVYADHPPRHGRPEPRSYRDNMGVVRNVCERGDGIYGDFHLNPKHALAEQAFWDAENAPSGVGFSINGDGRRKKQGGRMIVESLVGLTSVDLVSGPATTNSLFEGLLPMPTTVKRIIEALAHKRPRYAAVLREQVEAGVMSPDMDMDMPGEEPMGDAVDHEEALQDGFRAAVLAVLDDDTMDKKAKLARIRDVLDAQEKLLGGDGDVTADDEPAADTSTEEGRRAARGNLLEAKGLRLLGRKGVALTPLIERALAGCRTDAELTELVESLAPGTGRGQRPRSSAPDHRHQGDVAGGRILESRLGKRDNDTAPDDPKALAEWLTAPGGR